MKRTALARGPATLGRKAPLARTAMRRQPAQRYRQAAKDTGPTTSTRQVVSSRSGGMCEAAVPSVCLGRAANQHHRLPRRMGGTSNPAVNTACNLLDLCGSATTGCHGWIEQHRVEALDRYGWLLRSGADPAAVPAVIRGRLAWLTEEGRYVDAGGAA